MPLEQHPTNSDKLVFRAHPAALHPIEVLRVTPEGQFIWHEDADDMIEHGDFSAAPAMPHILRALRQRDALLKALKTVEWHGGGSCWVVDADKIAAAIAKCEGNT